MRSSRHGAGTRGELRSVVALGMLAAACTPPPAWIGALPLASTGHDASTTAAGEAFDGSSTTTPDAATSGHDEATTEPPPASCLPIDMLIVIDDSQSMSTYQHALLEELPRFVELLHASLPAGIDVHVGITTTELDASCDVVESPEGCQTHTSFEEVQAHYIRPDVLDNGANGSQGRLFEYAGLTYYTIDAEADPAGLSDWLSQATIATGLVGCAFEMPIAAATFSAHPANAEANAGFLRADAILLVFMLTDEPDKSLESDETYRDMLVAAKPGCGDDCILIGGLVPPCIEDVNQKLWQFMNQFPTAPVWGNVEDASGYADVLVEAFAAALARACE